MALITYLRIIAILKGQLIHIIIAMNSCQHPYTKNIKQNYSISKQRGCSSVYSTISSKSNALY